MKLKEGTPEIEEEEILYTLLKEIDIFRKQSAEYGHTFFIREKA